MEILNFSSYSLYAAFILYLVATFVFGFTIKDKRKEKKKDTAGKIAISLTILGFIAQFTYFVTRWIASGHAPVSNLFEFATFLGMCMVLAFIIIYFYYRLNFLGLFALPAAMVVIAFASMFPTEISPLVPSLQSHWLYIHVTTVALGQGILGVSFIAGLMYLIRQVDQTKCSKKTFGLETIIYIIFIFIGFIVSTTVFQLANYSADFIYQDGNAILETVYQKPAIAGPHEGILLTEEAMEPWFETPSWMQGEDAGNQLNTLLWSVITGSVIYIFVRLLLRRRVSAALQPPLLKVSPSLLDEIEYRAVAIGFPVFTLGGLIFASIWAQQAWGRFWGWDPKEVWALITFFFYAAYLHLRLSKGWHGEKSAWLAVIGFGIIMFNLIVVNLVLAGLHSYA